MHVLHAGLIAAGLAVAASAAAAPVKAPPKLLNIVRVKVKPRAGGPYATLEAQIVRAYDRGKIKVHWLGLSDRDGTDVLYLNLADSPEAWGQMSTTYESAMKRHPEIVELQQRLAGMAASTVSTLTRRRDDVDRVQPGVDFTSMRSLRLTIVEVRPGREGAFLDALRTAPASDGAWLVYEADESSTYALITLARTKLTRKDGRTMPRSLRRSKGIFTKVETRLYTMRPAMSHPAPVSPATTH